ncbi:MAG: response regulator transcription factor [Burkholderiales bacterium]|nr:MAG: response regulator transcription factor [Burkholderiales bacterium]
MTQPHAPTFLIVDDDDVFASIMARSLVRRGFRAQAVADGASAMQRLEREPADIALLDLRLEQESGLQLIESLRSVRPELRILIVTGYASIATAVEAVKRGAENYLPKPATADDVLRVLGLSANGAPQDPVIEERPLNPDRLKWEHIQRVLAEQGGNVSATARALGMHRRTLQRILAKRPVQER